MSLAPDPASLLLPFRKAALHSLRVAVVNDRNPPSPWVDTLVTFLRQIPGVTVNQFPAPPAAPPLQPDWLMDRLYAASRARLDPFGDLTRNDPRGSSTDCAAAVCAVQADAVIWLPDLHPPPNLASRGTFTVQLGSTGRGVPYSNEVARGDVVSTATVFWQQKPARHIEASTQQGIFFTLNAEAPIHAVIRTLGEFCVDLQSDQALPALPHAAPLPEAAPFSAARFTAGKLARSAQRRFQHRGKPPQWFIALRPSTGASPVHDLSGFSAVPLAEGVQMMADPFLVNSGEKDFLFYEEMQIGSTKGCLACCEILPGGAPAHHQILLERPYHLSYPCVVPDGGELFLMPESSDARRIDLFRFTRFPHDMELIATPLEGVGMVDTTPIYLEGKWYVFSTVSNTYLETFLFVADKLEGQWAMHPASPISTTIRSSRSAGALFWHRNKLYRPTQDCSHSYGWGLQINEVTKLTPFMYEERQVKLIEPNWMPGLSGTHTWTQSSRFQAIDGLR